MSSGRQRENHSDDTIENDSTESSSSDSETDNTEATDTELELSDDSKCELDGISSLFDERSGSDLSANDFSDAEERWLDLLVENEAEDKQGPTGRSTADKSYWETAVKSSKIAAGVAGVALALYAA